MYLHEDKEAFRNVIEQVSSKNGRTLAVVEKDYYVTLILQLLSEQLENCVFKGGTSLSKGFRVIDRFSEDIDITFDEHIGENRNVPAVIREFCDKEFYREDYHAITSYFAADFVAYEEAVGNIRKIAESGVFDGSFEENVEA